MALGAMASDPGLKVKIVPVGLSYFHPHRFRSRAVVEFGAAMDVPEELVSMFKEGGPSKRDAVAKLLDLTYDGLKTVTVRAPDYDTLMVGCNTVPPFWTTYRSSFTAYPSGPPIIQTPRPASDAGSGGRAEQAIPGSVPQAQGRTEDSGPAQQSLEV